MCKFTKTDKEKLGNCVIYIVENTTDLCKTKLLKLLYIMEESMVKFYSMPFLSIPYEVWKLGPVQKDIYIDLSNDEFMLLEGYIAKTNDGVKCYKALKNFDDSEFSDYEIEMMKSVIEKYGNKKSNELIKMLHNKDTEWYKLAKKHNLLNDFDNGVTNNSNVQIDLSEMLSGCDKERYKETLLIHTTARNINLANV